MPSQGFANELQWTFNTINLLYMMDRVCPVLCTLKVLQNVQSRNRNEVVKKETPQRPLSVRHRVSERRCREADTLVPSVEHAVKPFKPSLSVDKVNALARRVPPIGDDEVNISRRATYGAIERSRPDLGVGRELKGTLRQNSAQETPRGRSGNNSHHRYGRTNSPSSK